MDHSRVIVFIVILLAIIIRNGQTAPAVSIQKIHEEQITDVPAMASVASATTAKVFATTDRAPTITAETPAITVEASETTDETSTTTAETPSITVEASKTTDEPSTTTYETAKTTYESSTTIDETSTATADESSTATTDETFPTTTDHTPTTTTDETFPTRTDESSTATIDETFPTTTTTDQTPTTTTDETSPTTTTDQTSTTTTDETFPTTTTTDQIPTTATDETSTTTTDEICPTTDETSTTATDDTSTTEVVQTSFILGTIITNTGKEDATFTLTDSNDTQTVQQMLTGLIPTSEPDWPQFEFRGYGLVGQGIDSFPLYLRVFQGVIEIFDDVGSNFYQDVNGLESFLAQKANLPTSPSSTPSQNVVKRQAPAAGLPTSGSEPKYEPKKWNKAPGIRLNNCYNYATNIQGNTFAQPGRAGGTPAPAVGTCAFTCANFVASAKSDGLTTVNCNNACPKGSYKVALVLKGNKSDFHWYRQDDNGNWSHKPGQTKATNLDNSKKPLTDPRTCDRGAYTTFCRCFCVRPKKVNVRAVPSDQLADIAAAQDIFSVGN